MLEILDLAVIQPGKQFANVAVYIKEYTVAQYQKSNVPTDYVRGTVTLKGISRGFTIWDPTLTDIFKNTDIQGKIIGVTGDVSDYKGATQLKISSCSFNLTLDMALADFVKSVDIGTVFGSVSEFINTQLSQEAVKIVVDVFTKENLFEPFKIGWAASGHHDAQIGGLMWHTLKMLNLARVLIDVNNQQLKPYADLIYTGIIFHDIGKVYEIENGQYTEFSYAGHMGFAIEILSKHKDTIVQFKSEAFYYHLFAIIQGHHGEFGQKPTTVWGYIIHLIDMLDSQTTGIVDTISSGGTITLGNHQVVKHNASFLRF